MPDLSAVQSALETLPPEVREALAAHSITELTAVQEAMLAPATRGRDLRVVSQTGSGKTLAFAFALLQPLGEGVAGQAGPRPRAVVLTPTRELACQVHRELAWALGSLGLRTQAVIGGMPFGVEARNLGRGVDVLVGTPGRVLDHTRRGTAVFDDVSAVVLDEADEMLDLGFREDLQAILAKMPEQRRSHLVSATFGREVEALARQFQHDPYVVRGGPVGPEHADITHVLHVVASGELEAAITNLLLIAPDEATLIFVRTREGVTELADDLQRAGFSATALTGELEQRQRTRAMDEFRTGRVRVLVATDVAARGLDVPEVTRVLHVGVPDSAGAYTHRSGRTGRAGRKGTSIVLVPPAGHNRALRVLGQGGIRIANRPLPTPENVRRAADARLRRALQAPLPAGPDEERARQLADALLGGDADPAEVVTRLVARCSEALPAEPREVSQMRAGRNADRSRQPAAFDRGPTRQDGARRRRRLEAGGYQPFRVSWGANHGADPRRLLALCCRRGNIQGSDVGAIDVGPFDSVVEVRLERADVFERAGARPDPRDPRVRIRRLGPKGQVPGRERARAS